MENITIVIAITIILPIVYGLFYNLKEKEEKKIIYGAEFTVKSSKVITLFFFIWMVICLLGMIGTVIFVITTEEPNKNQMFWIMEILLLIFFLLGALGFFVCKYNYLVIKENGIYVKKMFKKDKLIKYSDITYISNNSFGFGQLSVYDSNGIPLFEIDHYHLGIEQLDNKLRNKGYMILPNPYPSEDMKNNKKFQWYKKLSSAKVGFWCFLLFGIASLLLGTLIVSQIGFKSYENYEVVGVVDTYSVSEETLKIHLENDDKTYYINNIVYDELNEDIFDVLTENTYIKLHVSYKDEYERYNISQIEINKIIYLNMESAELAEYSNYKYSLIVSYVFIGFGVILVILGVFCSLKIKKLCKIDLIK